MLLLLMSLTFYKYKLYDLNKSLNMFNRYPIENVKKEINNSDFVLDKEKYKNKIVNEELLSIDYNKFDNETSIFGKIYIDVNKHLYITDSNKNLSYKISDIKFKTIFQRDYPFQHINIFLLSESNELYILLLRNNDIKKVELTKIKTNFKIEAFADVNLKQDVFGSGRLIFALSEDGNIYDGISGIRYNENIISLYNKFYVFEDNTISTTYGNLLKDNKGNDYKIKYVFSTFDDNEFSPPRSILLVTNENKILYVDDENKYIFEYNKTVKNIIFSEKEPYKESKLEIVFEDENKIRLNAACNYYFCINNK